MENHFFSKLPHGHAIRSIAKAAAIAKLRSEPMVISDPADNVDDLRRQCAAVVWVMSDVYSLDAVAKLPLAARAFLLKLFGLPLGGAEGTQSRRIDVHVASFRPRAGGQATDASESSATAE